MKNTTNQSTVVNYKFIVLRATLTQACAYFFYLYRSILQEVIHSKHNERLKPKSIEILIIIYYNYTKN